MPGTPQFFSSRLCIGDSAQRFGTVGSRNPCGTTLSQQIYRNSKWSGVQGGVSSYHHFQVQFFAPAFRQRSADESPSILSHKIDLFGGNQLGRCYKISFILTVFIIYYNNQLALFYGSNGFINGI